MIDVPHLHQLLPHDKPMVLVDELIEVGENHVHCRATPSASHLYFDTDTRSIPAYVGIELMAQAVAGWSGYHAWKLGIAPSVGFLLGCRRYQAECSVFKENEQLDILAEQVLENHGMAVFSCRIEHQGRVLASSQINTYVPTTEKLAQMRK